MHVSSIRIRLFSSPSFIVIFVCVFLLRPDQDDIARWALDFSSGPTNDDEFGFKASKFGVAFIVRLKDATFFEMTERRKKFSAFVEE